MALSMRGPALMVRKRGVATPIAAPAFEFAPLGIGATGKRPSRGLLLRSAFAEKPGTSLKTMPGIGMAAMEAKTGSFAMRSAPPLAAGKASIPNAARGAAHPGVGEPGAKKPSVFLRGSF